MCEFAYIEAGAGLGAWMWFCILLTQLIYCMSLALLGNAWNALVPVIYWSTIWDLMSSLPSSSSRKKKVKSNKNNLVALFLSWLDLLSDFSFLQATHTTIWFTQQLRPLRSTVRSNRGAVFGCWYCSLLVHAVSWDDIAGTPFSSQDQIIIYAIAVAARLHTISLSRYIVHNNKLLTFFQLPH
jgi:hypothetical protein